MQGPVNGLGISNLQWQVLPDSHVAAIRELGPGGLLLLGYPESPLLHDKAVQEAGLCHELGIEEPLLRIYGTDIPRRMPRPWATVAVSVYRIYRSHGLRPRLIGGNEMNHPGEGGFEDWGHLSWWLKEFGLEARRQEPDILLDIPALWPDPEGRYRAGWRAFAKAGLQRVYGQTGVHIYTPEQIPDAQEVQDILGLPTCVTEYNRLAPSALRAALPAGVTGTYYFILAGDYPDRSLHLLNNPAYYKDFRSIRSGNEEEPNVPDNKSLIEKMPDLFEKWKAAGGCEDNFRLFLLEIEQIKPGLDDLLFMASQNEQRARQLREAIEQYRASLPNA